MKDPLKTLSQLNPGESGIINSFSDSELLLKLLEMGCLPGEAIKLEGVAPFGDPIIVSVSGYSLSMRKAEASCVLISQE
jgi:ferrous iron transport protein A